MVGIDRLREDVEFDVVNDEPVHVADGARTLSESELFRDKMFRALGVSPSVYVAAPRNVRFP
ncbi:MAG: hypothetical protein VB144_07770 [Clostridia bacterium]|nr:hypothetical protein [Clostridia bacterium]